MKRALRLVLSTIATIGWAACRSQATRPATEPVGSVAVPRTSEPIVIDGKCGEASWQSSFRSPAFVDAQSRRTPSTQVRAIADDQALYLEVYVADIDLESKGDIVKMDVGPLHIDLTPTRAIAPAGVTVAMDTDGTIDTPNDHDEEWISELSIPWTMLGAHSVPFRAMRIDVGNHEPPHALAWPRSAPTRLTFDAH